MINTSEKYCIKNKLMNQKKLDYLRSPNSIDSEEYENARKIFKIFAGAPLIEHYSGSEMLQERFYD